MKNSISFLGVCSGLGQTHAGLELAPGILRKNGIISALTDHATDVSDLGDLWPEESDDKFGWRLIAGLREKAGQVLSSGNVLLTIGGDHSIAIGTIQASLKLFPTTRVIWVDAHGDINTPQTSLTGNLHGMPLAALLGLFETPIGGPRLLPENLLLVGLRDVDPEERKFLNDLKIDNISSEEAMSKPALALERIQNWIARSAEAPIHLSFDIDSINPEFAPATGIRVPGGLSLSFAKKIAAIIEGSKKLISLDFVEINPAMANSSDELNMTIQCAKEIIKSALTCSGKKQDLAPIPAFSRTSSSIQLQI